MGHACTVASQELEDGPVHQVSAGPESWSYSSRAPRLPSHVDWTEEVAWTTTLTDDSVIEYLTDVEGNWEYFLSFVQKSEILYWSGDSRGVWGPGDLRLKPHGILVFGGDAPDKGPGDIRFIKLMVMLKSRHPKQVFLVLGNRDLQKLRFASELSSESSTIPGTGLDSPWLPPWDKAAKPFEEYLKEQGNLPKTQINKLKWLLHCTMGCQWPTFLTRKEELAHLQGSASDEDVLKSYTSSVDPGSDDPWMLHFLKLGQMALVLGDSLFVHGGLQDDSIGYVPKQEALEKDVHTWVKRLNEWKERELRLFIKGPEWVQEPAGPSSCDPQTEDPVPENLDESSSPAPAKTPTGGGAASTLTRAAAELIAYGTPGYGTRTIIYFNPFDNGNPVPRSAKVQHFLVDSGIRRLFSGHQPHGQTPTVVRHMQTGLLAITADTSRSDSNGSKVFNENNNRGRAISIVRVQGPWTSVVGEMNDGIGHGFRLNTDMQQDELPDMLVGRQLVDQSWVKTIVSKSGEEEHKRVIAAFGQGFKVSIVDMNISQACLKLKKSYGWGEGVLAVALSELAPEMLAGGTASHESCADGYDDIHTMRSIKRRHPLFELEEFMKASTFVFSFNGVVRVADLEARKKIVDNVNKLIAAKKRVVFVTNDSTLSRRSLWTRINEIGINMQEPMKSHFYKEIARSKSREVAEEMLKQNSVVTSAHTAVWYLKQRSVKNPFCVTFGTGIHEELREAGITTYYSTVDEKGKVKPEFLEPVSAENICNLIAKCPDVDAIVIGWHHQLSALTIAVAAQYIRWNKELGRVLPCVACSQDKTGVMGKVPTNFVKESFRGLKVGTVGNGGMADVICRTAGPGVEAIDCGKPSDIFATHMRWPLQEGGLGIDFEHAVYVGDSMDTDIVLANKTGMRSLLVLSGITHKDEYARKRQKDPSTSPTWVIDSFAHIHDDASMFDRFFSTLHSYVKSSSATSSYSGKTSQSADSSPKGHVTR